MYIYSLYAEFYELFLCVIFYIFAFFSKKFPLCHYAYPCETSWENNAFNFLLDLCTTPHSTYAKGGVRWGILCIHMYLIALISSHHIYAYAWALYWAPFLSILVHEFDKGRTHSCMKLVRKQVTFNLHLWHFSSLFIDVTFIDLHVC